MIASVAKRSVQLLVTIVYAATLGCAERTSPSVTLPATAPDEEVLLALDYYEPMYQVDAAGRVIKLRLTGRHLPLPVLGLIGKLTELRGLDFYGTTVTDDGLALLKDLQKLRSVGLGSTPITDKGLAHLEKLPNLQWLWLPKDAVTEEGVETLKSARPDMHVYVQ